VGTGGSSAGGTGAAAGTGGANMCGNGVVDPGETCDTGITSGAGACNFCPQGFCPCPVLVPCVARTPVNFGTCQQTCAEQMITAVSSTPDMCCAGTGDPDCPGSYPIDVKKTLVCPPTSTTFTNSTSGYVPLPVAACNVPVVMTFTANDIIQLGFNVTTPGMKYPSGSFDGTGNIIITPALYTFRELLIPVKTYASFFSYTWTSGWQSANDCVTNSINQMEMMFRPLHSTPVVTSGAPARPQVTGDSTGEIILYEDASGTGNAIKVVLGRVVAPPSFAAPTWTPKAGTTVTVVAADGLEPSLAIETHPTPAGTWPTGHVAWLDADRATLRYAAVGANGAIANAQVVRTGTGLANPRLVRFDATTLGLAWLEQAAGHSQLRFVRLDLASGATVGSVLDVTNGEGDALEPALSAHAALRGTPQVLVCTSAVAWVDTRSGARQLYYQAFDCSGAPSGAAEIVSNDAVSPTAPDLAYRGSGHAVAWTDQRGGGNAVYIKDNNNWHSATGGRVSYTSQADLVLSPAGEDAHGVRLEHELVAEVDNDENGWIAWESGNTGSQVRVGRLSLSVSGPSFDFQTGPLQPTCADTSSPTLFKRLYSQSSTMDRTAPTESFSTYRLGAWIEAGALVVQPLFYGVDPRLPY